MVEVCLESAEMTGRLQKCNMALLGYLYKGAYNFLSKRLEELMDLAKKSLEIKREIYK